MTYEAGFKAGIEAAAAFVAAHGVFYRATVDPLSVTSDPPLTPETAAEVAELNLNKICRADEMDRIAAAIRALAPPSDMVAVPVGTEEEKAEQAIDWIDAKADAWAESVNLTGMVKNVTHPMTLNPSAPAEVRQKFREKMEQSVDAIIRLAFVEGWLHGDENRHEVFRARAMLAAHKEG